MTEVVQVGNETIETPYLSDEVHLKKVTPFHAQLQIIKYKAWRIFAHHPVCSKYKDHYFKIGQLYFCIGCTMLYSGIFVFTALFFSLPQVFQNNPWVICSIPFAGFGLAISHLIFRFKNKWIKTFLRFIAGIGVGAYLGIVYLVPDWWLRFALISLLLAGNTYYGKSRGPYKNIEKCFDCPLRKHDPPCDPNLNTLKKINKIYGIVEYELEKIRRENKQKKIPPESTTN
jgi:hypothetical protein